MVHRDTATRAEFEHYLNWWLKRTVTEFPVLYIALHGGPGLVQLPNGEDITIEELTGLIGEDGAAGRVRAAIVPRTGPRGTTAAALQTMLDHGFNKVVALGLEAAARKAAPVDAGSG